MFLETPVSRRTTDTEAMRLARELYGIEAAANPLPGEHDDNFHLMSPDGREFVLKVMHPVREPSFIDAQCRALQHLAEREPQLGLPRVIPSPKNELFTAIGTPDGATRLVWLLSFVRGKTLAQVRPHPLELLEDLGRFLGRLDAALQSFSHL